MSDPTLQALRVRFAPVFNKIAAGAVARESERQLAHESIALLAESGFTAVRVPVEFGGSGASISQFFDLLTRLGEADSNLVQALRAHFTTVESFMQADTEQQDQWLPRIVAGEIFGNATTEKGNQPGQNNTTLFEDGGQLWLEGTKFYSTGSLYADWISVSADRESGSGVRVIVHRDDAGVQRLDDWDGFGQRLTASGTTHFTRVLVDPAHVQDHSRESRPEVFTSYVQLVLLAALTGIARAVRRDAVEYVQGRTRTFDHGVGDNPQRDPLVEETVGRLGAKVFGVEAALRAASEQLEKTLILENEGILDAETATELHLIVAQAQLLIGEAVPDLATQLFEVGGASAASESRRLDRHWRNARVIASHNPLIYRAREIGQQLISGDADIHVVYVGAAKQNAGSNA